jgi:outer membrane protein OmpA-like peptidoglycan-associated protein
MRILVIGFVVFVIWSCFATWLYVSNIKPAISRPVASPQNPVNQIKEADSLMQYNALLPKDLIIWFEFDNSLFKSDPKTDSIIAEYKKWLDKNPGNILSITGHTDFIGTSEYNKSLGFRRAQIVKEYLESKGIAVNRITVSSKGEDQPVDDNITHAGRAKNRRTEITINK